MSGRCEPPSSASCERPGRPVVSEANSYGLFVASNGKLKRLETMRMRVPDTRIALGGLITKPSPVTLPDGKLSFIAFSAI